MPRAPKKPSDFQFRVWNEYESLVNDITFTTDDGLSEFLMKMFSLNGRQWHHIVDVMNRWLDFQADFNAEFGIKWTPDEILKAQHSIGVDLATTPPTHIQCRSTMAKCTQCDGRGLMLIVEQTEPLLALPPMDEPIPVALSFKHKEAKCSMCSGDGFAMQIEAI